MLQTYMIFDTKLNQYVDNQKDFIVQNGTTVHNVHGDKIEQNRYIAIAV